MTKFHDDGRVVVDSIAIPGPFVRVASNWYNGMGDMLYAVCSTGGLTTGTNCPVTDFTDSDDRDQKWYYSIWLDLASDVGSARDSCFRALEQARARYDDLDGCTEEEVQERCDEYNDLSADYDVLTDFEEWAENQVDTIEHGYPVLEDWSGE